MAKCISEYNTNLMATSEIAEEYLHNYLIMDISEYKRQYLPLINENGDKVVWVNSFCSIPEGWNWHTDILGTNDGGNCYFNLTLNLTKRSCEEMSVNGYA